MHSVVKMEDKPTKFDTPERPVMFGREIVYSPHALLEKIFHRRCVERNRQNAGNNRHKIMLSESNTRANSPHAGGTHVGIPYAVRGSPASTLYGMVRTTRDVIAEMQSVPIQPFITALQNEFFVDEDMIRAF